MRAKLCMTASAAALTMIAAAPAMAGNSPLGTFTATLTGTPSSAYGSGSVSTDSYYTGPLQFTIDTGTWAGQTFTWYCVDLSHNVTPGGTYTFTAGWLTENGAGTPLSVQVSDEVGVVTQDYVHGTGINSVAAQAVIWELEYPGTNPIFSGMNQTALTAAYGSILSFAENLPGPYYYADAVIPSGYTPAWPGGSGFDPPQAFATGVPEPSTWAMMGLGFAGLAFAGYRARRTPLAIA